MREALDVVMRPLMRAWVAAALDDTRVSVPRPVDAPHAHADGSGTTRVLIFGNGIASGWGVLSHDLALPGALARSIAADTGRGVDVDLIAVKEMTMEALDVPERLSLSALWRYDIIVMTIGLTDAVHLTSPRLWRRSLGAIVEAIRRGARPDVQIVFAGMPPVRSIPPFDSAVGSIAARRARALTRVTEEVAAATPGVAFAPVTAVPVPEDGRHRTPQGYQQWGDELAAVIGPIVTGNPISSKPAFRDESERQAAVDALALSGASGAGFDPVVALARRLFGTEAAAFSVVDGDDLWFRSAIGVPQVSIPCSESFCAVTIQYGGGMVVADAREDDRFDRLPLVTNDPGIRFDAGYPVNAPNGEPIGAICVFDTHARRAADVDVAMLRRLALLVEAEIESVTASRSVPG